MIAYISICTGSSIEKVNQALKTIQRLILRWCTFQVVYGLKVLWKRREIWEQPLRHTCDLRLVEIVPIPVKSEGTVRVPYENGQKYPFHSPYGSWERFSGHVRPNWSPSRYWAGSARFSWKILRVHCGASKEPDRHPCDMFRRVLWFNFINFYRASRRDRVICDHGRRGNENRKNPARSLKSSGSHLIGKSYGDTWICESPSTSTSYPRSPNLCPKAVVDGVGKPRIPFLIALLRGCEWALWRARMFLPIAGRKTYRWLVITWLYSKC